MRKRALDVFKRAYEAPTGTYRSRLDPAICLRIRMTCSIRTGLKYDRWQDAVTRTAFSHRHSLSFSGGSDKLTAVANVSYKIINYYVGDL